MKRYWVVVLGFIGCSSGNTAQSSDAGGVSDTTGASDAGGTSDAHFTNDGDGHADDSGPPTHGSDSGAPADAGSKDGGSSTTGFPGQPGNPVGYAAAPGYPGSLKTTCISGNTISASGTASAPLVYSFCDFVPNPPSSGTLISGSHLKFIGCRFQSNDVEDYNVQITGSDITIEYSSVTPLVSLATAPPHEAWPSAGAGLQLSGNGTGYQISGNDGYEYGINIPGGGPVTIDHSDIWGFGNAVVFYSTTAQMTVSNSWIHDAADAAAQMYHTDGPGYLNGGTAPQNVSILNNTIASIGNTNGIAFQATDSVYANIVVSGNYLSGFGYTADMGLPSKTSGFAGMMFTNNVLGTDLPWVFGPIYADESSLFSQSTNTWSGNTLKVLSGTSPIAGSQFTWTPSQSGEYLWPDSTMHTADF
jgi:Right handed beta helix region